MTPTLYQKAKYKSLLKEIPELEMRAARRGWKWTISFAAIVTITSALFDYVTEPQKVALLTWLRNYNWLSILIKVSFWTFLLYFIEVKDLKSSLKNKRKEIHDLLQKCPALAEEKIDVH